MKKTIVVCGLVLLSVIAYAEELVLGEERVDPGLIFIFEGAVKDKVFPLTRHLARNETNIHIEARVNWDEKNIPKGTPPGGFVPYLYITAKIINQRTKVSTFIDLLPHINLIDNFHYARNIALPGAISDKYKVIFSASSSSDVPAIHADWKEKYGNAVLLKNQVFSYSNVDFEEIAKAERK